MIAKARRPNNRRVIASVDWGFTNPGVIQVWLTDSDGRLYLVHEIYRTQRTIDWWVAQARALKATYAPEVFTCDPSEPGFIRQFEMAGLPAEGANNDIALGIQKVQERLANAGDGRPRLVLRRGAMADRDETLAERRLPVSTEQEFDVYVWPKSADGKPMKEKPVDVNNHGMDALRYAVMYVDNATAPPTGYAYSYRK